MGQAFREQGMQCGGIADFFQCLFLVFFGRNPGGGRGAKWICCTLNIFPHNMLGAFFFCKILMFNFLRCFLVSVVSASLA